MLQASHIVLTLGGTAVLRDVSLEVRPGEILAVIGPNGAGKSSLLNVLSGAQQPDQGQTTLDGVALADWRPADLARRRAVMPQAPNLSFPFRVLDVVLLGRSPHAGCAERSEDLSAAKEALRETDASHLAERNYLTLSGGERQRAQLARVLAQIWSSDGDGRDGAEARYLLLDEPTNNLDIAHQQAMMITARRLADAGEGVLAVLHDPNLAVSFADRICVLSQGRVTAEGRPDDIMTQDLFETVFGLRVALLHHPGNGRKVMVPA